MALFVQHPCITPELSTGLGLVLNATVAMPVPAPRASVAAPAMTNLDAIVIKSLPDDEGRNKRHARQESHCALFCPLLSHSSHS